MCKINWEERTFDVAKGLLIHDTRGIEECIQMAKEFIDAYKSEFAEEETPSPQQNQETKKEKDNSFEEVWVAYRRKGSKKKSLDQWNKLSLKDKENVKRHIPIYVESVSEVKFQRDFERYLRDKVFNNVLYDRFGFVLFDPDVETTTKETKNDKLIIGGVEYK